MRSSVAHATRMRSTAWSSAVASVPKWVGQQVEESAPSPRLERGVGRDHTFGRSTLCRRLAFGEHVLDRVDHPVDVAGGEIGCEHQGPWPPERAQQATQRVATGGFAHGHQYTPRPGVGSGVGRA